MSELDRFHKIYWGQVARRHYVHNRPKECRAALMKANLTYKTIGLYFTSFFFVARKFVLNRFDVTGTKKYISK